MAAGIQYYYKVKDEFSNDITDLAGVDSSTFGEDFVRSNYSAGSATLLSDTDYDIEVYVKAADSDYQLSAFELNITLDGFFDYQSNSDIDFNSNLEAVAHTTDTGNAITVAGAFADFDNSQSAGSLGAYGVKDSYVKLFTIEDVELDSTYAVEAAFDLGINLDEYQTVFTSSLPGAGATDFTSISIDTADALSVASSDPTYDTTFADAIAGNLTTTDAEVELTEVATVVGTKLDIGSSNFTTMIRSGADAVGKTTFASTGTVGFDLDSNHLTLTTGSDVTLGTVNYGSGDIFSGYKIDNDGTADLRYDTATDLTFQVDYEFVLGDKNEGLYGAGTGLSIFTATANNGADQSDSISNSASQLEQVAVTYAGDLNYDGMVSMQDLAFLNAGAVKANTGGSVSAQVDANNDGSISSLDLIQLNDDWGDSLYDVAATKTAMSTDASFLSGTISQTTLLGANSTSLVMSVSDDNGYTIANSIFTDAASSYDAANNPFTQNDSLTDSSGATL